MAAQVVEGGMKLTAASCGPPALESEKCARMLAGVPSSAAAGVPAMM